MKTLITFFKNNILLFFSLTIMLILLLIFSVIPYISTDSNKLVFSNGTQHFTAFKSTVSSTKYKKNNNFEHYYLFLPSYVDYEELSFAGYMQNFKNETLSSSLEFQDSLKGYELNTDYICSWNNQKILFTIMKSSNLSTMYIETTSADYQKMWENKEYFDTGRLSTISPDGKVINNISISSMHCRGNYSFVNYAKKPYAIELDDSISLLGLGVGKDYCLLSFGSDPTLLRNHLAREMEKEMGLDFDNLGVFIDLYINSEYQGCYYLVEEPEISPNRINITNLQEQMKVLYPDHIVDSTPFYELADYKLKAKEFDTIPSDITGGYLVEREFIDRYKKEYHNYQSSFMTDHDECFILHSPKACSVEQVEYLQSFFNELESALLSKDGICKSTGKSYKEYVDVESFTIKYITEEFCKNFDGGISSNYFYKDSDLATGKLYAAPAWDFDMSMGNYLDWMTFPEGTGPYGFTELYHHDFSTFWFKEFCNQYEQDSIIKEYYNQRLVPYLEILLSTKLEEYESYLHDSQLMNEIRWKVDMDQRKNFISTEYCHEELYQFIKERKEVCDKEWKN